MQLRATARTACRQGWRARLRRRHASACIATSSRFPTSNRRLLSSHCFHHHVHRFHHRLGVQVRGPVLLQGSSDATCARTRASLSPSRRGNDVLEQSREAGAGRGRGATRPYARRRGRCRRGGGTSTEAEGRRVRFLCGTGKDLDPSRREGGASKRASEFRPRRRGAVFLPGGETVGATRAPVPDPRRRVENERAQGRSVSTPVEGASETRPPPGLDRRKIRPMWWIVHVPRPLGRPGPPVCHRGGLRCVPAWQGSFLDLLRVDPGEWTNPG